MGTTPVVGVTGRILVADVGATFPAGPETEYAGEWRDLGSATTDGMTSTAGQAKSEFGGWKVLGTTRVSITSRTLHLAFALEEWNEGSVMLAFGGGEVVPVTGGFEYHPPVSAEVDFKALAVEAQDGDLVYRWHIFKGLAADDVETVWNRDGLAALPIGFDVLWPTDGSDPWAFQTNDPTFISDFLST